jgi:hypothetical protein
VEDANLRGDGPARLATESQAAPGKKRLFDPETRAATDEEVGLGFTDYQVRIEVLGCLNLNSKDSKSIDGWRLPERNVELHRLVEDHSIGDTKSSAVKKTRLAQQGAVLLRQHAEVTKRFFDSGAFLGRAFMPRTAWLAGRGL